MLATPAVARPQRPAPARRRALPFDASRAAAKDSLTRAEIAGPVSLIGRHSLTIVPERGLALQVRSGFLWIAQDHDDHIVGAGECFVAEGSGPVVVAALETTELRIEWPAEIERLSPGLERPAPSARSSVRGN